MNNFSAQALEKATQRLKEGIELYNQNPIDIIRDGLIQRFEFSYELSCKILLRFLKVISANPQQFDTMNFSALIRYAYQQNLLLGNWNNWKKYRDMRNKTSHTYDEKIAKSIILEIPNFLGELLFLLVKIAERLKQEDDNG